MLPVHSLAIWQPYVGRGDDLTQTCALLILLVLASSAAANSIPALLWIFYRQRHGVSTLTEKAENLAGLYCLRDAHESEANVSCNRAYRAGQWA